MVAAAAAVAAGDRWLLKEGRGHRASGGGHTPESMSSPWLAQVAAQAGSEVTAVCSLACLPLLFSPQQLLPRGQGGRECQHLTSALGSGGGSCSQPLPRKSRASCTWRFLKPRTALAVSRAGSKRLPVTFPTHNSHAGGGLEPVGR